MKTFNIKYIFLFALAAIGISVQSCNDFLDVKPQGQITEEEIRTSTTAANNLVTGVYNSMWDGTVHGFGYVGATNIASDDGDKGSSPDDGANTFGRLDNLNPDAQVGQLDDIWAGNYKAIARANQAIDKLQLSTLPDSLKNSIQGEARFLRAYFYFNLVRFFGGVPLIDRVPAVEEANNPAFQTRASREDIYKFIIADLTFAMNSLPIKGAAQVGRANKGSATGLLAKVYLYQNNYQRVFALTDSLVTGKAGVYDLLPNYEDIWRETGANGAESIFEVQTGTNSLCNSAIDTYSLCQGPRAGGRRGWADLGFGFNSPSQSLVNAYEPNDKRRAATIIFINPSPQGTVLWDGLRIPSQDSVENSRYNYKAYHSRTAERFCGDAGRLPKNLRILRFGDVLLMHAEAAFALGNVGTAVTDINRIRTRAGLPAATALTRQSIWRERRVELAMEHDRYFDLVRQEGVIAGTAIAAFQAQGKTFTKNKNELFPIPANQIALSGGRLTQNPGY